MPVAYSGASGTTEAVLLADLNEDGQLEAITVGAGNKADVFVGNVFGGFGAPIEYDVSSAAFQATVADFDRDGHLDLATASFDFTAGRVSVMLGNGDGTLRPKSDYATGAGTYDVAAGDVDNDGIVDLVTANSSSASTVSVLLGNGDGTFADRRDIPLGLSLLSIAVEDLNADGRRDIVTTDYYYGVYVLLGNGDGSFVSTHTYAAGQGCTSATIGDLNADGKPDIVVTNYASSFLSVFLGNGDGSFGARADYGPLERSYSAAIGDFDADGHLDLAAAQTLAYTQPGIASVFLGSGTGTFGTKIDYPAGHQARGIAAGDLNGDGFADLVTINVDGYNSGISVLLNLTGLPDTPPVVVAPATAVGLEGALLTIPVTAADPDGEAIASLTAAPLPFGASFTKDFENTPWTFSWIPGPGAALGSPYSVDFTASNSLTGTATTVITLTNVNRAPVVTAPASVSGPEGSLLTFGVTTSDPDGDPIDSLTAVPLPVGASFIRGPGNTSGTFSWTPSYIQSGTYSVTIAAQSACRATEVSGSVYTTCNSGMATVAITVNNVNRPPVVTAPVAQSVNEGVLLTFPVTTGDPDGEPIASLSASSLPAGASFVANGAKTSGTFSWAPGYDAAAASPYSVVFSASSSLPGSATTVITVNNVNPPPVVTAPASVSGTKGSLLTFSVTASDPDGEAISSLTASALPSGASFTAASGNASGTLSWTPGFDAVAGSPYSVTFAASNTLTGTATTVITVSDVDRAPVVTAPAAVSGPEGSLLTFSVTVDDPDGDPIEYLTAAPLPPGAVFTPNSGKTSGTFSWTPSYTQAQAYPPVVISASSACRPTGVSGAIECQTGTSSVEITIFNTDRAAVVAAPDSQTVNEEAFLSFTVTASDPDGDAIASLTAAPLPPGATFLTNGTNTSGSFEWTSQIGQADVYAVTFAATSGALTDSAETRITVRALSDLAIAPNSVRFTTEFPFEGQTDSVTAKVRNVGPVSASPKFELVDATGVSPTVLATTNLSDLAPGESLSVSLAFATPAVGDYRLRVRVTDRNVSDRNLADNEADRRLVVVGPNAPDPSIPPRGLKVDPATIVRGNPAKIRVWLANLTGVPGTFDVVFTAERDGIVGPIGTLAGLSLAAYETRVDSLEWMPDQAGTTIVRARIEHVVPSELNGANNERSVAVEVLTPALGPMLGVQVRDLTVWAGERRNVPYRITNRGDTPLQLSEARISGSGILSSVPFRGWTLAPGASTDLWMAIKVPQSVEGRSDSIHIDVATFQGVFSSGFLLTVVPDSLTTITVHVTDTRTSDPLNGVLVSVEGLTSLFETDATGTVLIPGVLCADREIALLKEGYLPRGEVVQVRPNLRIEEALEPGEFFLSNVDVERMTLEDVIAAGLDPNAPENQWYYRFAVNLYVGQTVVMRRYILVPEMFDIDLPPFPIDFPKFVCGGPRSRFGGGGSPEPSAPDSSRGGTFDPDPRNWPPEPIWPSWPGNDPGHEAIRDGSGNPPPPPQPGSDGGDNGYQRPEGDTAHYGPSGGGGDIYVDPDIKARFEAGGALRIAFHGAIEIQGQIKLLKEFFRVGYHATILAPGFVATDLRPTLAPLPAGLVLPRLTTGEQSRQAGPFNIGYRETASATWYLRADAGGTFDVCVDATGIFRPAGSSTVGFPFQDHKCATARACGKPELYMEFTPPPRVAYGENFTIQATVTNLSSCDAYNVSVEIFPEALVNAEIVSPGPVIYVGTVPGGGSFTVTWILRAKIGGEICYAQSQSDARLSINVAVGANGCALDTTIVTEIIRCPWMGPNLECLVKVLSYAWELSNDPLLPCAKDAALAMSELCKSAGRGENVPVELRVGIYRAALQLYEDLVGCMISEVLEWASGLKWLFAMKDAYESLGCMDRWVADGIRQWCLQSQQPLPCALDLFGPVDPTPGEASAAAGSSGPIVLRIRDEVGRYLGVGPGGGFDQSTIPAAWWILQDPGFQFAALGQTPSALTILGSGQSSGVHDVGFVVPAGSCSRRQVTYQGVPTQLGSRDSLTWSVSGWDSLLHVDLGGDGVYELSFHPSLVRTYDTMAITNVQATQRDCSIDLSWSAPTYGTASSYRVNYGTAPGALDLVTDVPATSATLGPLARGESYFFTVQALDVLGGAWCPSAVDSAESCPDRAPVVAAPTDVAGMEAVLLTVEVTATDPDAEPIASLTAAPLPAGAVFSAAGGNASGALTWTPAFGQAGPYEVTFTASNGLTGSAVSRIKIAQGDRPPIVTAPAQVAGAEGAPIRVAVNASDPDGNAIISLASSPLPAGATFSLGSGNTTGTLDWTPAFDQAGHHEVIFTASNALSASDTTSIDVANVDRAPTVIAPAAQQVDEGSPLSFVVTAADPDGDPIATLAAESLPVGATFAPAGGNGSGTFSWTPGFSQAGADSVIFRAANALQDSAITVIVVRNVNRPPVASAGGPYAGVVTVPLSFDGAGSSDPDGDALAYHWDFGDGGTAEDVAPSHIYTSAAGSPYAVTLTVTDTGVPSLSATATAPATISDVFQANVYTTNANRQIRLGSGKPQWAVQIESVDGGFSPSNVDLASIVVRYGGEEAHAILNKTGVDGDKNGNGILEISAAFSKTDLRLLFATLPAGKNTVTVNIRGNVVTGGTISGDVQVDVHSSGAFLSAALSPNPFNPEATLTFTLPTAGPVKITLFDLAGHVVRRLMDEPMTSAGYHDVRIDGHDSYGRKLASGVYFYAIETSAGSRGGRMVLLK